MDEQLFYDTHIMPLIAEIKCFSGMLSGKRAVLYLLSSLYFMHLRIYGQAQVIGYLTVCPHKSTLKTLHVQFSYGRKLLLLAT